MRHQHLARFTVLAAGLQVRFERDTNAYAKGIKVTDAAMAALNITGNATISPEPPKPPT